MEIREMTAFDVSEMARMVLSLMNGMGMEEFLAHQIILNIKEEYGLLPPILW